MPYILLVILLMYSPYTVSEERLNTTLEGVEQQIIELNKTIQKVDAKIDQDGLNLQQKQNEEIKIRKNLVKQLNTFNGTVKDIIRIQRLPQKALIIIDGLKGQNKRKNVLEKGQNTLQRKILQDKKALKILLQNLTEQEKILNDLSILKSTLGNKKHAFNKLRKIQIQLLTLEDSEKEYLILKAEKLEKSLNLNTMFQGVKSSKTIKNHAKTNITYHNMPVEGIMIGNYKQKDEKGIHSQGISILASPSATVKAVKDGHIIYSNIFREYGYLVILEHSDGYHTLYSGLNGGSKEIGDFISAGDTIGVLPAIEKPILYLEVRKDGTAVNPNKILKIKTKN